MRFCIVTLGCKVNAYESQYYADQLESTGFQRVPADQECELCIINTCTVTNNAAHKSRQKINQAKHNHPNAYIVAVGCFVQFANEVQRNQLGVDLIIGAKHKDKFLDYVQKMIATDQKMDVVTDVDQYKDFEAMPIHCFESKHRAFLKIEDGCNQFCSYCAIPFARGRERSLAKEQVLSIAEMLVEKGHSEIVLTGIHTGRYLDGENTLTSLLKSLLDQTPAHVYYRISSIEITEVSDELIDLIKKNKRICHHLHIPIQSGCDETLKRMNRPYSISYFKERVLQIRQQIPDISISTDVIVGFVQESDEEFEQTYKNIQDIGFSFLHVFPYSKRSGTKASFMKGEVHGSVVKERTNRLLKLSKDLRIKDMERFDMVEVLIETNRDNIYKGYTNQYHPIEINSTQSLNGRIMCQWDSVDEFGYHTIWKGSHYEIK